MNEFAADLQAKCALPDLQFPRQRLATYLLIVDNDEHRLSQFLGHLSGRRGARGPVPIAPGALLVIDEASMISGPDLADLIGYAQARWPGSATRPLRATPAMSWPGSNPRSAGRRVRAGLPRPGSSSAAA
jgi:hypothetical protein